MAYSQTLKLVTGDTLPELTFTLRDSNTPVAGRTLDPNNSDTWAPIDVSGATVRLRMRELGSSTVKASLTCLVIDGEHRRVPRRGGSCPAFRPLLYRANHRRWQSR